MRAHKCGGLHHAVICFLTLNCSYWPPQYVARIWTLCGVCKDTWYLGSLGKVVRGAALESRHEENIELVVSGRWGITFPKRRNFFVILDLCFLFALLACVGLLSYAHFRTGSMLKNSSSLRRWGFFGLFSWTVSTHSEGLCSGLEEMEEREIVYLLARTPLCFADTICAFPAFFKLWVRPLAAVVLEGVQQYQCCDLS